MKHPQTKAPALTAIETVLLRKRYTKISIEKSIPYQLAQHIAVTPIFEKQMDNRIT